MEHGALFVLLLRRCDLMHTLLYLNFAFFFEEKKQKRTVSPENIFLFCFLFGPNNSLHMGARFGSDIVQLTLAFHCRPASCLPAAMS